MFGRSPGISLLVPTQNAEQTVELCIRSFAEFPDEIIVVDNGSSDNTKEIVRALEKEYCHLTFYDAPQLKDLYENRQYALERSHFNWIVRIDSDYVAHTSGQYNIAGLRERIVNADRTFRPTAFGITQVNLSWDYKHTGEAGVEGKGAWVQPPVSTLAARIVQWYPGMRFQRLGRWEGVRWQKHLRHVQIAEPYWFHCNFKSEMGIFFRSERTNWRELGDFQRFPSLDAYIQSVIVQKYGTNDMERACRMFIEQQIKPKLIPYDEGKWYPYPEMIIRALKFMPTGG